MLRFVIYMYGPTSAAKLLRSEFVSLIRPISNINFDDTACNVMRYLPIPCFPLEPK